MPVVVSDPSPAEEAKSVEVRVPKFDVGAAPMLAAPPEGFVDLATVAPTVRLEIRYASEDNFTGAPLPGYAPDTAWLTADAARALARVQADLEAQGLGLLVYDAYRPLRATRAMVRWAETHDRVDLLDDGYVARKSNHNRGNTVDLTLVELGSGAPLDMATPWDTFSEASHYAAATGSAMKNRRRLREAMQAHGFVPYEREWWHFTFASTPEPPPLDVPYQEPPPEGGTPVP